MTRKRIRHELIPNVSRRNATFERRANGFFKKADELSTLCGIEVAILIQKQGPGTGEGEGEGQGQGQGEGAGPGEGNNNYNAPVMWPSPAIFNERLQKFLEFPAAERNRKMVMNDKLIETLVNAETECVLKAKERVHRMESNQLLTQLTQGKHINDLDPEQLSCLYLYSAAMLEKLAKRETQLNTEQPQPQPEQPMQPVAAAEPLQPFDASLLGNMEGSASHFGAEAMSPTTALIENLTNDQWFIESMSEEQNRIDRGDNGQ